MVVVPLVYRTETDRLYVLAEWLGRLGASKAPLENKPVPYLRGNL
jgi:hypothetical protein